LQMHISDIKSKSLFFILRGDVIKISCKKFDTAIKKYGARICHPLIMLSQIYTAKLLQIGAIIKYVNNNNILLFF